MVRNITARFVASATAQRVCCGLAVASLGFNLTNFRNDSVHKVSMSSGDPDMQHSGLTFEGVLLITNNYVSPMPVPFFWSPNPSPSTVSMIFAMDNTAPTGAAVAQSIR